MFTIDNARAEKLTQNKVKNTCRDSLRKDLEPGKRYPFLVENIEKKVSKHGSPLTNVLASVKADYDNHPNMEQKETFSFPMEGFGLERWEEFCATASGGRAIEERDLIGAGFWGHIEIGISKRNDKEYTNLVADEHIGYFGTDPDMKIDEDGFIDVDEDDESPWQ